MRYVVGIVLGMLSGFLIYMIAAIATGPEEISGAFVAVTFLGGWVLSSFLLVRGTRSVSKVFSRAFLLGAAEWLAVIPAGIVMGGKSFAEIAEQAGPGSEAEQAGAALGAGCFSFLTGGFAVAMAVVCLIGFAVSYFMGREMKPETAAPTKKCPECAEMVQAEARRCRYCGADLVEAAARQGPPRDS